MTNSIELGGQHLDLVSPIRWGLSTGFEPFQTVIETDAEEADKILAADGLGKAKSMTWKDDGGKTHSFNGVYILGEAPASLPHYRGILLSDRRWKWPRILITGHYNIRRRTGDKRLETAGQIVPIEIAQSVDEFFFAPWSLNNGEKWKVREMILDVLEKLSSSDGNFGYTVTQDLPQEVPINDLDICDAGNVALAKAFRSIPGADLYIDENDEVQVINTLDQKEISEIPRIGPQIYGGGNLTARRFKFQGIRPKSVKIYYVREHELRFDSTIEGDGGSQVASDETRGMDNVLPVTDPTLQVNGISCARGTWITMDEGISAYQEDAPSGAAPLSHQQIQKGFFLDKLLAMYVDLMGGETPDPIWMGRVNAIKLHYRQTYRIKRRWMDRIAQIRPVRAGIIDSVTGTRALAQAFTDYAVRYAVRVKTEALTRQSLWANIKGYSALLGDTNCQMAPALVKVLDEEVGIVRIEYQMDPFGRIREIFPANLANIPTADVARTDSVTCINERLKDGTVPKLTAGHRAAVVLTAIPASPNSKGQFYSVEIKPEEIGDLVPATIGTCSGPVWEIFIGPGLLTARFAWLDGQESLVERAFGIGAQAGVAGEKQAIEDAKALQTMLVNEDEVKEFARAMAAQLYAKMIDRPIGSKTVRFSPDVKPVGSLKSVIHQLTARAEVVTTIETRQDLMELDAMGLLPDSVRRVINREVMA